MRRTATPFYGERFGDLDVFFNFVAQMAERPGGLPEHGYPLQVADGRGQLQLAVSVSVRLSGGRGEDRHIEEGVVVFVGRDREQNPGQTRTPSVGRRSFFGRRLSRLERRGIGRDSGGFRKGEQERHLFRESHF